MPSCFRLFVHWARLAASLAAWTAGSAGRDHAVLRVDADGNPLRAKFLHQPAYEGQRLAGPGADDHAAHAGFQGFRHGLRGPQTAAELDEKRRVLRHALHQREVLLPAGKSAVEIDHVKMAGATGAEVLRDGHGVGPVDRLSFRPALLEPDHAAAPQINRGKNIHAGAVAANRAVSTSCAKLRMICSPARWLFSGWNWVAMRFPRTIAAAKGWP